MPPVRFFEIPSNANPDVIRDWQDDCRQLLTVAPFYESVLPGLLSQVTAESDDLDTQVAACLIRLRQLLPGARVWSVDRARGCWTPDWTAGHILLDEKGFV